MEASRFRDKRSVNKLELPFTWYPDKGEIHGARDSAGLGPSSSVETRRKKSLELGHGLETKAQCGPVFQLVAGQFIASFRYSGAFYFSNRGNVNAF